MNFLIYLVATSPSLLLAFTPCLVVELLIRAVHLNQTLTRR